MGTILLCRYVTDPDGCTTWYSNRNCPASYLEYDCIECNLPQQVCFSFWVSTTKQLCLGTAWLPPLRKAVAPPYTCVCHHHCHKPRGSLHVGCCAGIYLYHYPKRRHIHHSGQPVSGMQVLDGHGQAASKASHLRYHAVTRPLPCGASSGCCHLAFPAGLTCVLNPIRLTTSSLSSRMGRRRAMLGPSQRIPLRQRTPTRRVAGFARPMFTRYPGPNGKKDAAGDEPSIANVCTHPQSSAAHVRPG